MAINTARLEWAIFEAWVDSLNAEVTSRAFCHCTKLFQFPGDVKNIFIIRTSLI
jgi:hypothetical protein